MMYVKGSIDIMPVLVVPWLLLQHGDDCKAILMIKIIGVNRTRPRDIVSGIENIERVERVDRESVDHHLF
jgi:hypothetical protein